MIRNSDFDRAYQPRVVDSKLAIECAAHAMFV
jgi:hypothetical protein